MTAAAAAVEQYNTVAAAVVKHLQLHSSVAAIMLIIIVDYFSRSSSWLAIGCLLMCRHPRLVLIGGRDC